MEFRCRLASPNGEIVEGVYVADSESRLRHELEEKGLYVLSLQPKNAIAANPKNSEAQAKLDTMPADGQGLAIA